MIVNCRRGDTSLAMTSLGLLMVLEVLTVTVAFQCPKGINQAILPDPKDCRKYYHCLNDGRVFHQSCARGLVFDAKTSVCVWDAFLSCIPVDAEPFENVVIASVAKAVKSSDKSSTTSDSKTTTATTENVTESRNDSDAATTSHAAEASTAAPETPAHVEHFGEETTAHPDHPAAESTAVDFSTATSNGNDTDSSNGTDMRANENPTDATDTVEMVETEMSTKPSRVEVNASFKTVHKKILPKHSVLKRSPFDEDDNNNNNNNNNRIENVIKKITCPSAFSYVADPDDCHTFYHCNNWRPFQKRCPPGLFFDSVTLVCNWPHNVNCIDGFRAKTYFAFNTMKYRMHTKDIRKRVKKIKTIVESTTEKIPFLETIENDVKRVRYEESNDATTSGPTRKVDASFKYDYAFARRPSSKMPEPSNSDTTTTDAAKPTAYRQKTTDFHNYDTSADRRSTWKDWNFDLFYTASDRGSYLDKLEVFSNDKKSQHKPNTEYPSTDEDFSTDYTNSAYSSVTTEKPTFPIKSIWGRMKHGRDYIYSQFYDDVTTTDMPATSDTSEVVTSHAYNTGYDVSYVNDDENKVVGGDYVDQKSRQKAEDGRTNTFEPTSRTLSIDFGTDEHRERNHPRKIQHDNTPPGNPFLAAHRTAASERSQFASDYRKVDNVEIEKFMMKMVNDAMDSKDMVAEQADEEYDDDNLVDDSYHKNKKTKERGIGGSDVVDKWAAAAKNFHTSKKAALVEDTTAATAEDIESSGDVDNTIADIEQPITNLIMKDEASPISTSSPEVDFKVNDIPTTAGIESKDVSLEIEDVSASVDSPSSIKTKGTTNNTNSTSSNTTVKTSTTKIDTSNTTGNVNSTRNESTTVKSTPSLNHTHSLCAETKNCTVEVAKNTEGTRPSKITATEDSVDTNKTTLAVTAQASVSVNVTVKNVTVQKVYSGSENVAKSEATISITPMRNKAQEKPINEFMASVGHPIPEVDQVDKKPVQSTDRPSSISKNKYVNKTLEVLTVAQTDNSTVVVSTSLNNTIEVGGVVNATLSSTGLELLNSTLSSNGTAVEKTTSVDNITDAKSSSPTSSHIPYSPSTEVKLEGGKGTTKKSFISLSDLIKWYLRHWRHYSRWKTNKESLATSQ